MEALKQTSRQFAAFVVIGLIATIAHYGTLILMVEKLQASPTLAAMCGFAAGGLVGYPLNKQYAFASNREHQSAVPRFVIVIGIGFILTGLLMHLLTHYTPLHYVVAQVFTTIIVLFWHFVAHKFWTFKEK